MRARVPESLPVHPAPRIRVGVVCDLVEENWTSMDLVAEMTLASVARQAGEVEGVRVRPAMHRRFSTVSARWSARTADRLLNRFWDYPRYLGRLDANFDLYHVMDHSYAHLVHALPPAKTIVSCYDMNAFACLFRESSSLHRVMARHTLEGMQKAAKVICCSNATRDELVSRGLIDPARLEVVHLGVDPDWSPCPDPAADAEAMRLLPGDAPRILHVGSTIPRKRIDVLLQVFAEVREQIPGLRLARVGGPFTAAQEQLAASLGVREAIDVMPRLSRAALAAVYRRCGLLLLTSEYEGFGLPVVEAMACGLPVLATDLAVLREVGGNAAAYCPLENIDAWRNAAFSLLHQQTADPKAWAQRKKISINHAERFSWDSYAARLLTIYKQILEEEKKATCECFTLASTIRRTVGESRAT